MRYQPRPTGRSLTIEDRRRQYRDQERDLDRRLENESRQHDREEAERNERLEREEAERLALMTPEQIAAEDDRRIAREFRQAEERQRHQEWLDLRQAARRRSMTCGT